MTLIRWRGYEQKCHPWPPSRLANNLLSPPNLSCPFDAQSTFSSFRRFQNSAGSGGTAVESNLSTCQYVNFWSHATDSICAVQGSTFSFNISTVTLCTSNHSFLNRLRLSAVPSGHIAILHLFDRSCLIDSQPYLSHSLMGYPLLNGLPLSLVPPSLGVVKRG